MFSRLIRLAVIAGACFATATAVVAADPVAERQAAMKDWGKLTRPVGAMLQGKAAFDLATVQAALDSYVAHAATLPALFPAGSDTGKSESQPAVWTQKAEFDGLFTKFGADAKAARAAITDEASFKANFPDVVKSCGTCHQTYRKKS